jgi:hypothetical protein
MLDRTPRSSDEPNISLTLARATEGNPGGTIRVPASQLIAYSEQTGFTRLKLAGGKVLDVREGTDQIDRLVRAAASQADPALQ